MEEIISAQSKPSEKIQNPGFRSKVSKLNLSKTLLGILAFVITLIVGVSFGYMLGYGNGQNKKSPAILPQSPASAVSTSIPPDNGVKKIETLMEKKIDYGKITVYRTGYYYPDGDRYIYPNVFAIKLDAFKNPQPRVTTFTPEIYSVSSTQYMEDGLFEIVGDELWVVNGQTNKIDVYKYQTGKFEDNTVWSSTITYKNSIDLPKYDVGTIYSIKCNEKSCEVLSAFHQESGCGMDLNIATKQYSNIKCSAIGGEFTPKPL